jgi:ABC-type polysaccharide/polyol phosphate export permease
MTHYDLDKRSKITLSNTIARARVEIATFFMVGFKQQASLAPLNALFSLVIPSGIFLLVSMMPIEMTQATANIYLSGSMLVPMSNLCVTMLAQILLGIRMNNGFEHLATLPILRISPLVGMFLSSAIGVLPAVILNPYIGMLIFGVTFSWSIWLILVLLLTLLIMINIGSIVGTISENYHASNTISMIAMFFVMFATPTYYSIDSLPFIIQIFQRMLPFTYSLEAIRSLMETPALTSTIVLDFAMLLLFWITSTLLAFKLFSWKQRA